MSVPLDRDTGLAQRSLVAGHTVGRGDDVAGTAEGGDAAVALSDEERDQFVGCLFGITANHVDREARHGVVDYDHRHASGPDYSMGPGTASMGVMSTPSTWRLSRFSRCCISFSEDESESHRMML